ncbi:MAG: hypothetical protein ACFFAJ_03705 [Candidatus Hodarchaeota archaeon]
MGIYHAELLFCRNVPQWFNSRARQKRDEQWDFNNIKMVPLEVLAT